MIYDIATEPCDEQYHSLIDYAIAHSDAVMLVFSVKKGSKLQGEAKRTIRKQLAQWRIKTRRDSQWPVTTSYDTCRDFTIDLYTPSQEVKAYLMTQTRLFAWGENGAPQDIAFFKKNQCWLATCSHEQFGWADLDEAPSELFMQCLTKVHNPKGNVYNESY